jgi:putative transposase
MKYTQSEKMEIIRMVEESSLSVKQTLREMDGPHSSFYEWYRRYKDEGYDGAVAQGYPEKSGREIAWLMTDQRDYFISESSVYRILKAHRRCLLWSRPRICSSIRQPGLTSSGRRILRI